MNPSLVTCLKLQHRAAPTEKNLVGALRVATGDWRADPNLTVDEGCVVLGDASNIMAKRGLTRAAIDIHRYALDMLFSRR